MVRFTCFVFIFSMAIMLPLDAASQEEDFPEFIHKDKLYKTGSSWFTIGSGLGYFPGFDRKQRNFMVDLNSRIKKHYFTLGFHYDGDNFITLKSGQRFFEFHGGYGWRSENLNRNLYVYAGPGYALGHVFHHSQRTILPDVEYETTYYKSFTGLSLYGEVQYAQKIFYDIGVGTALYASVNKNYQTVGIRLFLYFSTAYIDDI